MKKKTKRAWLFSIGMYNTYIGLQLSLFILSIVMFRLVSMLKLNVIHYCMFYSCILKSAKVAHYSIGRNAQQQFHVPVYDTHDFIDLCHVPTFLFLQDDEIVFSMETITFLMIISVLLCMFPVSAHSFQSRATAIVWSIQDMVTYVHAYICRFTKLRSGSGLLFTSVLIIPTVCFLLFKLLLWTEPMFSWNDIF